MRRFITAALLALAFSTASSAEVKELTTKEDIKQLSTKKGYHVVVFYAVWCGYCKEYAPVFNKLEETYKAGFYAVNIDTFGVQMAVPTTLIMKDGKEVDRVEGAAPLEYMEKLFKEKGLEKK